MPKSRVTGENRFRALLVSAPWQYQLMPCLGICALSAYGRQHGFAVDTLHACRRFHTELSRFAEDELRPSEGEAIGATGQKLFILTICRIVSCNFAKIFELGKQFANDLIHIQKLICATKLNGCVKSISYFATIRTICHYL